MSVYTSIDQVIGKTPMLELKNIERKYELKAKIFAKLENLNPAGSLKDRVAKAMIDDAEKEGLIGPGSVIIEPTSGNTGIGIAAVGACRGYRVIIVMPDSMSVERINLIKAYGAEIVLTPGAQGMKGAVEKAEELHKENPGSIIAGQFENPSNPKAHYLTTGPEIYDDLDGKVDVFISGIGTGGTITGTGKYLKEKNPQVQIIAIEPETSPLLLKGKAGPHKIQGIGANFIPKVLDTKIYDKIIPVSNEDSFAFGKELGKTEGVLAGISSGAVLWAAVELAKKEEYAGKNIVIILCDTGDRYLSTPLFSD
ncbi:cysteine synthase A [Treponema rectale]|uniref:cysteine synthase n=1 Tax=Treponema rectale TaxID=744512 RepID=A0A840SFG2_9SPIR|nr:cysteine synthase A [Treponema rectale]MBB5218293.1 cysteine synthase A [Treponema rectale]QOS40004.1 cysteine synthase A [Treponema rectale]